MLIPPARAEDTADTKQLFAPQLRVECRFLDGTHEVYHMAAVEFPFASTDGTAIKHYSKTSAEESRKWPASLALAPC